VAGHTAMQLYLLQAVVVLAIWCQGANSSSTCFPTSGAASCGSPGWFHFDKSECCLAGEWICWRASLAQYCTGSGNMFIGGPFTSGGHCCLPLVPWQQGPELKCVKVSWAGDCITPGFHRPDQQDCCLRGYWECSVVPGAENCGGGKTYINGQCCSRLEIIDSVNVTAITAELSTQVPNMPALLGRALYSAAAGILCVLLVAGCVHCNASEHAPSDVLRKLRKRLTKGDSEVNYDSDSSSSSFQE